MSGDGVRTYLWIVEWDDRFIRPSVVNVHRFAVDEANAVDFEAYMREEQMLAQGSVSTRAGGIVRQTLLREKREGEWPVGFDLREEDASEHLSSLIQSISVINYITVATWPDRARTDPTLT